MASVDTIKFRLPLKTRTKLLLPVLGEHLLTESYPLAYAMPLPHFRGPSLSIFSDLLNEWLKVYMDDFTPYEDDFEPALDTLEKVLQRCIATRLYLSHEKFYMMMTKGLILGHYSSEARI